MTVIGTAGHVDHGKSALVRALTGIDPDRLREEKERGLTIELGFAWLTLPSGREVSIVDVPGHERFIKNMLAGAGGVDLALLVVAADEGPMPQTREHLAILDLLDVPTGIVVLTKMDLVDGEYADLVEAELEDTLKGSKLEDAPVIRVSAVTGDGLPALLATIDRALDVAPAKRDIGRPRLPIDRAFTVQGFGAVVTGTLLDGALEVGREVELQPGGLKARIRGLQRHREKVSRLEPGTRAAVNLSGVRAEEIQRGMVLSAPGATTLAHALDVHLEAPAIVVHPLSHDAGVTVLSATSESEAKLRLLDCDLLLPRQSGWAQLVLESPAPVVRGDRCIVRTPNETVAGGVIVNVNPPRKRRGHPATIAALEAQLHGSPEERLEELLARGPLTSAHAAASLGIDHAAVSALVKDGAGVGSLFDRDGLLVGRAWLDRGVAKVVAATADFLGANRLRLSAPREHVRGACAFAPAVFDLVLGEACLRGILEERPPGGLATAGYAPVLHEREAAAASAFLGALRAGGANPQPATIPPAPLLAYLAEAGEVIDTGAGVYFDRDSFERMVADTRRFIESHGSISLAEARDLFGTSRKYAQAFLEHLDVLRVTRRTGDARTLR